MQDVVEYLATMTTAGGFPIAGPVVGIAKTFLRFRYFGTRQ